jgi:hypothetical protein
MGAFGVFRSAERGEIAAWGSANPHAVLIFAMVMRIV